MWLATQIKADRTIQTYDKKWFAEVERIMFEFFSQIDLDEFSNQNNGLSYYSNLQGKPLIPMTLLIAPVYTSILCRPEISICWKYK